MTRYLCPDCEGGGMILLDDVLSCSFCGGSYKWVKGEEKEEEK